MLRRGLLKSLSWIVPLATMWLSGSPGASAAELSIPLSVTARLSEGTNQRLLIKFALPDSLSGCRILLAQCEIDLKLDSCSGNHPSFIASPITKDWIPNAVSWDSAWASESGNSSPAGSADVVIEGTGYVTAKFSVTEWLQSATKGRTANRGFVLRPIGESEDACAVVQFARNLSGRVSLVFTR